MTQWEYLFAEEPDDTGLTAWLNELGLKGWEMISTDRGWFWFKRPLPHAD